MREQLNIHKKKGPIPMKFMWCRSETILNPMQKKIIKIGSQLAKKSGNIDTNKQNSVELRTSPFFEVG